MEVAIFIFCMSALIGFDIFISSRYFAVKQHKDDTKKRIKKQAI